jgi:uncharacterized protein
MTDQGTIDYEAIAQNAMRGVVRAVLMQVVKTGLPGEHHFYIEFKTDAPGVSISKRLKEKYRDKMTIVLQHRFWDLIVADDKFEVKLTFDAIPERLSIPYSAIKIFYDPSVPYALQFEDADFGANSSVRLKGADEAEDDTADDGEAGGQKLGRNDSAGVQGMLERTDKRKPVRRVKQDTKQETKSPPPSDKPATPRPALKPVASVPHPAPAKSNPSDGPGDAKPADTKIVSLDQFRKK